MERGRGERRDWSEGDRDGREEIGVMGRGRRERRDWSEGEREEKEENWYYVYT